MRYAHVRIRILAFWGFPGDCWRQSDWSFYTGACVPAQRSAAGPRAPFGVASFSGLPRLRFLIACSCKHAKEQAIKNRSRGWPGNEASSACSVSRASHHHAGCSASAQYHLETIGLEKERGMGWRNYTFCSHQNHQIRSSHHVTLFFFTSHHVTN